jgi:Ca-activated chloride channel family protein
MKPFVSLLTVVALIDVNAVPLAQPIRSGIELVSVDALVMNGRTPVAGLTAADFELRDNGVVQAIKQLALEQLPLRIAMSFDISSSVEGERLRQLKAAASSIIQRLRPQDRASVSAFSHRLDRLVPLTGDRPLLTSAVGQLEAGGGTSLRDAAFAAIALRDAGPGRRLVVLFSDGVDTTSFLSDADVLRAAERSDAVIYPVAVRTAVPQGPRFDAHLAVINARQEQYETRFLRDLAGATGGRLVLAEGDRDIGAAFARVLDEFSNRYVLAYTPAGVTAPGWHRIDLKLKQKKGTVTARRGYFGN